MIEASPELVELTRRLYKAVETGDAATLRQTLWAGPEAVFIGTAPDEWWRGAEPLVQAAEAQAAAMGGEIRLVASQIKAYRVGDFGWSFDTGPMFELPGGAQIHARTTLIFLRHDGEWRLVHSHNSIGVPNESAFGEDVTAASSRR